MANTISTSACPTPPCPPAPRASGSAAVAPAGLPHRDDLLDLLTYCEGRINDLLKISRSQLSAMREDEQSYFNFVNAENTCGMSAWWLGRPASAFRYDAARNYVSALEDIRYSIDGVRAHIRAGELPPSRPAVRRFFDGPMGRMFDWPQILSHADADIPDYLLRPNDAAVAAALVSLANRQESDDMAILTAKSFQNLVGDTVVQNLLPDSSVVIWNSYGRDITNAAVSLPQLLGYASGAGIGVMVARSTKATALSLSALNAMGRGRYLLPATPLLRATASGTWNSHWLTRGLANFGFNFVKFQAYAGIGYAIAGRYGMEVAGGLFMGGIGATAGFAHGWLQRLATELIARDVTGTLAQWLLKDKMSQFARVTLSVELPALDHANTLKLVTARHARSTYEAMTAFQGELVQAEQAQIQAAEAAAQRLAEEQRRLVAALQREATRLAKAAERTAKQDARLRGYLGEAEHLAATLPETRAKTLLQGVRAAAEKPVSKAVVAEVQALIAAARTAQAVAASARTPRAMPAVTPSKQPAIVKPGTRAERMATHVPSRGLPRSVAELIATPPPHFGDVIDMLDSRIFEIDPSCRTGLAALYDNGGDNFKKLIILRLSEIDSVYPKFSNQWKPMKGTEGRIMLGGVGVTHEISVRNNGIKFLTGPTWTVVGIRNIATKTAARAATPSAPLPGVTP